MELLQFESDASFVDFREALFKTFESNRERLISKARLLGHIKEDAEDLAHEALIRGLKTARKFDGKNGSSILTWLTRILINLSLDRHRWVKRSFNKIHEIGLYEMHTRASFSDLDLIRERMFCEKILLEFLERLSQKERDATRLIFLEGLSTFQVAGIMNTAESTVRVYIYRARTELKKLVKSDPRSKDFLNSKAKSQGGKMGLTSQKLKPDDVEYRCLVAFVGHFLDKGAYERLTEKMVEGMGFVPERVSRVRAVLEAEGFIENKDGKFPAEYNATRRLRGRTARDVWSEIVGPSGRSGHAAISQALPPAPLPIAGEKSSVIQGESAQTGGKTNQKKGGADMAENGNGHAVSQYDKVKEAALKLIRNAGRTTVAEVMEATGLSQACVSTHMRTMDVEGLIKPDKTTRQHVWRALVKAPASEPSKKSGDGLYFRVGSLGEKDGKVVFEPANEKIGSGVSSFVDAATGNSANGLGSEAFQEGLASIKLGLARLKSAAEMNKNAAAIHIEGLNLISDGLACLDGFVPKLGRIARFIEEAKALVTSESL